MNAVLMIQLLIINSVFSSYDISKKYRKFFPLVINTWPYKKATDEAWNVINNEGGSKLDAVVKGCSVCEIQRLCDDSVGYGGHPNEEGDTTLDAMIMDGVSHRVGAVGNLKRVKGAISVARAVMDYTEHTLLVGDDATMFAKEMGFKLTSLKTNVSIKEWKDWKNNNCQPNYRRNVRPDHTKSCGPYKPIPRPKYTSHSSPNRYLSPSSWENHDTIGMIVIDKNGNIAGGTTTNGMNHKVPGRVGDSPIVGSGAYVDNTIGGAVCTGDGDVMMRFVPAFHTVMLMHNYLSPDTAARAALKPIIMKYPHFSGAIIAATIDGEYGGACHNFGGEAQFTVRTPSHQNATVVAIKCSVSKK